eukprot:scaffold63518_cov42-Cyclotella_meneghiniana.AAC.5
MRVNDAIIERFRKLFGEDYYNSRKRRGFTNFIAYRDRGVFYSFENIATDEEIIKDHLEGLSFDELNAIDKNGISLLHLAVFYNRAGQNGCGFLYNKKQTDKNIVRWLLENDSFYQKGVQGCYTYYIHKSQSGTALHLAFSAAIDWPLLEFNSENHGGRFGWNFVAGEAIESLLDNEAWARENINSLNKDGLSALEVAVKMAVDRCLKASNIVFSDGSRYGSNQDGSIFQYHYDFPRSIQQLMDNPFIRIYRMFGLSVSALNGVKCLIPKQLDINQKLSLDWSLPPGLKILHELIKSIGRDRENDKMAESISTILLSKDSGNLKDSLKAQSLVIAIYSSYDSFAFNDNVKVCWMFNPCASTKGAGGEMRKFFVQHAASALYSVKRYIQILHQEFRRYSLCDVGEELCKTYDLPTPLWKKILAFTGFRNDNHKHITRLCNTCEVIDMEVVPFFFGCIQACLDRTLELRVPSIAWDLIFDFAGLNAKIFISECCANCGKVGNDDVRLKKCKACYLVKYCDVECQKAHRRKHKKACMKRAAELKDNSMM